MASSGAPGNTTRKHVIQHQLENNMSIAQMVVLKIVKIIIIVILTMLQTTLLGFFQTTFVSHNYNLHNK